ncbi:hypothetical protein CCHR01_09722 [Colletotrichum chrysophilum]|uniref:Uncharacterized protein n=1 Tax=Colletotrichum chrysophilum TaxID=1836956 RepID=A0AAD9AIP0_9PEZI|nr:hypothetical protein CCHR01_09722 [Colletotrichum chrysophilum]
MVAVLASRVDSVCHGSRIPAVRPAMTRAKRPISKPHSYQILSIRLHDCPTFGCHIHRVCSLVGCIRRRGMCCLSPDYGC